MTLEQYIEAIAALRRDELMIAANKLGNMLDRARKIRAEHNAAPFPNGNCSGAAA